MNMVILAIAILGILTVLTAYHHPKLGAAIGVGATVVSVLLMLSA